MSTSASVSAIRAYDVPEDVYVGKSNYETQSTLMNLYNANTIENHALRGYIGTRAAADKVARVAIRENDLVGVVVRDYLERKNSSK